MRRIVLALAISLVVTVPVLADDDLRFRRTTPRAPLRISGEALTFGVPAGRAWGLESRLVRVGREGATVAIDLAVSDHAVSEGFVRVAWYARDEGRPRQIAIEDAPAVLAGIERRVVVRLEPPDGAVAFRVRVLARVGEGAVASSDDALTVSRVRLDPADRPRPALTRLLGDPP